MRTVSTAKGEDTDNEGSTWRCYCKNEVISQRFRLPSINTTIVIELQIIVPTNIPENINYIEVCERQVSVIPSIRAGWRFVTIQCNYWVMQRAWNEFDSNQFPPSLLGTNSPENSLGFGLYSGPLGKKEIPGHQPSFRISIHTLNTAFFSLSIEELYTYSIQYLYNNYASHSG